MVRFWGACLAGALVLVLGVGGLYHVLIGGPRERAHELAQAERRCGPFFTPKDSQAVFGVVPSAGLFDPPGDASFGDQSMADCQFTVAYAGHTVKVDVGYTCGSQNVGNAWSNSDESWQNDPPLKGVPGAVYDKNTSPADAAAARVHANGASQLVWWGLHASDWIPPLATMTTLLQREISHAKHLKC